MNYKIIYLFSFVFLFLGGKAYAEEAVFSGSEQRYGLVDFVDSEDSFIIIGDLAIKYTDNSQFQKQFGARFSNVEHRLKSGTPVVYQLNEENSSLTLKNLQIISRYEYEQH